MLLVKKIRIDIYKWDVFVVSFNSDSVKDFEKKFKMDLEDDFFPFAHTFNGGSVNGNRAIIMAFDVKNEEFNSGVVAHECLHATNAILENAGVEPSFTNDENQAYILEFLVNRTNKILSKWIDI